MGKEIPKKKNPFVFMDVSVDGDPAARMIFELFSDIAPKTAENFRALCTGEKGTVPKTGKPLHYKGSFFHRIIKGSMAQGGDFGKRDGTSEESIYGGKFPDETPRLKHDGPGLLSMSMADRDSLGSQFIVTFDADHHLDRKYVAFGKLVHGNEVLKKIESAGDEEGKPSVTVKIINCGEIDGRNHGDKKKFHKLKMGKHKKSSKDRKKRRRRYSSSESESSFESETDSSESDSDSDSHMSSSSDISSSSDDKRKKRKRSSKRDRYKRAKRKDKHRDRRRKRHYKRTKRRSRR